MSSRSRLCRQPGSGTFLGATSQVQQWQFSENEALQELQSSLSSTCQAVGFQGYSGARGGGSGADENRISKLKTSQTLLFFIRFCLFVFNLFYLNALLIAMRLWKLIPEFWKKFILTIFLPVFSLLLWRREFWEVLAPPCSLVSLSVAFYGTSRVCLSWTACPSLHNSHREKESGKWLFQNSTLQGNLGSTVPLQLYGEGPFSVCSFVS